LKIVPADKLIMGIPFYAHSYLTESDYLGSFRVPGSEQTGYSKVVYLSSCSEHPQNTASSAQFDALSQTPWFSYTDDNQQLRQCYFEDERSITAKMKLVNENKLKGVGVWAMGLEGGDHDLWKVIDEYKPLPNQ
jgi:spore germination protein YaaH